LERVSRTSSLSPSAVALGLGTAIQTGLVVAGLSAATVHAPAAFAPLKYIGASYLVFMGLQRLLAKNAAWLTVFWKA
jgi:threonine/homoserine/homoserine lactone efflux protein